MLTFGRFHFYKWHITSFFFASEISFQNKPYFFILLIYLSIYLSYFFLSIYLLLLSFSLLFTPFLPSIETEVYASEILTWLLPLLLALSLSLSLSLSPLSLSLIHTHTHTHLHTHINSFFLSFFSPLRIMFFFVFSFSLSQNGKIPFLSEVIARHNIRIRDIRVIFDQYYKYFFWMDSF